ncbi:MAG: hypothetical protein SGI88_19280 [Candidatus Hydrogenedentes bacterium]|nr:hypothetical protein [Candidatus Hydrogenedentota bacterium]
MNNGYVYQQFGVWWVFIESSLRGPIRLSGPYRDRDAAEAAMLSLEIAGRLPSAS